MLGSSLFFGGKREEATSCWRKKTTDKMSLKRGERTGLANFFVRSPLKSMAKTPSIRAWPAHVMHLLCLYFFAFYFRNVPIHANRVCHSFIKQFFIGHSTSGGKQCKNLIGTPKSALLRIILPLNIGRLYKLAGTFRVVSFP